MFCNVLSSMKADNTCPKCSHKEVIRDAKAVDRGHGNGENEMKIVTFKHPDAFIFKGQHESTVSAYVCARCGYVEYYVDDLETLKEAGY